MTTWVVRAIEYAADIAYERFPLQNSSGSAALHIALKTIFKRMGNTRIRFNAFRRFTGVGTTCVRLLIDYWMGHENPDMSTRYGKQLLRKESAEKEKVGLGFELPQVLGPQSNVNCATCATNSAEQACTANA